MRLLDRYLLREFVVPLFYCLAGFQIFWTAFDLFSNLQMYQEAGLRPGAIAQLYVMRTPELLTTVVPIALLLASLYTLTNLARYNEITAVRAAGISLARLSAPFFLVAGLMGGTLFWITEFVAPNATAEAQRMLGRNNSPGSRTLNFAFQDGTDSQTWIIKQYDPQTRTMEQPSLSWESEAERLELFAANGGWTNGGWVFHDVSIKAYTTNSGNLPERDFKTNVFSSTGINIPPERLMAEAKISTLDQLDNAKSVRMSLAEIREYQALLTEAHGKKHALLLTQFHGRVAQPFTCLVVVLVALPFGAATGRRNVFVGVAGSVGICFAYFILLRWGLALGTAGLIPPVIAAWLPNAVFTGTGLALLRKTA